MNRLRRIQRIKAIEREYKVAQVAVQALQQALRRDTGLLREYDLSIADLEELRLKLEPTYILRMFAEFETGLRDFWTRGT